jgi:hypothetical protein
LKEQPRGFGADLGKFVGREGLEQFVAGTRAEENEQVNGADALAKRAA